MSRPRKPFGMTQPGRLPATMMKILAAEMSDPARHRRGKQYASDGSVLDIIIEPGAVTCEIQGSRSTPYVAIVQVTSGSGMPLRRDITCTCSCPDDDNWDGHACKHVVATLYTLSNEFLIEPELLDVWRGNDAGDISASEDGSERTDRRSDHDADHRDADGRGAGGHDGDGDFTPSSGQRRRHLSLVRDDDEGDAPFAQPAPREVVDSLAPVLGLQPGTELPDVPVLELADLRPPKDRELAAVLRDALQHVRVDWD
jgi:hypothetical protein